MPETGNSTGEKLSSLADRLKAKTEEERRTTEKMIEDNFENLSLSLNASTKMIEDSFKNSSLNLTVSAKNALGIIERAIWDEAMHTNRNVTAHVKLLNNGFMKHWLMCALLGLGLMLGMFAGGFGLTRLALYHLNSLRTELTSLKQQIATEKTSLRQIQSQTWGLELLETAQGRFIILPSNMTPKPGWNYNRRPAIKLE